MLSTYNDVSMPDYLRITGLQFPKAPEGSSQGTKKIIEAEHLRNVYENNSNKEVMRILHISAKTLIKLLVEHNIPRKRY